MLGKEEEKKYEKKEGCLLRTKEFVEEKEAGDWSEKESSESEFKCCFYEKGKKEVWVWRK